MHFSSRGIFCCNFKMNSIAGNDKCGSCALYVTPKPADKSERQDRSAETSRARHVHPYEPMGADLRLCLGDPFRGAITSLPALSSELLGHSP